MGGEVQHFALLRLAERHHIFDVLEMSPRPNVDEEFGENDEGDLEELDIETSALSYVYRGRD